VARPVGDEQDGNDERGGRDELEETAARVFRIGEAGRDLQEFGAAEQLPELHGHEADEEQVQDP
jgi:hypothetical protein